MPLVPEQVLEQLEFPDGQVERPLDRLKRLQQNGGDLPLVFDDEDPHQEAVNGPPARAP